MRKSMLKIVFLLLACLGIVGSSLATTITVELDGSGDFTQIQPALDAAASGDTVLIGPGEFTELNWSSFPGYDWDVEVCAYVHVPNLTIIGAGAGQTILGPTTYQYTPLTYSPKCMVWLDGNDRFVEGITFRNCYEGIHVTHGPIYIDGCEFRNNGGYGIFWQTEGSGGLIRNSQFSSNVLENLGLFIFGSGSNVIVENCVIDGCDNRIRNVQGASFFNCEIMNSRIGVHFSNGARGVINNCQIHDCSSAGVILGNVGPHCDIIDSTISGANVSFAAYDGATLFSSGSIFEGGSDATLHFLYSGPAEIHNSHIISSGSFSVECDQPEAFGLVTHDMTGNYWGTTNPDTVAEWIWDQNDDPDNFSIVNYLPMADGPVPTENTSFGSIKAMFR